MVTMIHVDSAALDQYGFDEEAQELHVVFKKGRLCIYSQVPVEVWEGFQNAESKGTYLREVIKARGYAFRYDA